LVTGGRRGIGTGIAASGSGRARIAFAYRVKPRAAGAGGPLRRMQALGRGLCGGGTDIQSRGGQSQLVKTVADRPPGRIDILVKNVGDFRWNHAGGISVEELEERVRIRM